PEIARPLRGEVGGHAHQLLGTAKRQRREDHGVDDREQRAVGADAERQRQDGHGRKGAVTPRGAQRVAKVAEYSHGFGVWGSGFWFFGSRFSFLGLLKTVLRAFVSSWRPLMRQS